MAARVLVVEDERVLLGLLERFLNQSGFQISGFVNGAEALAAFDEEPEAYRAAVIDLTLPDYMGTELLARLRSKNPGLAAVLCSGFPEPPPEASQPRTCFLQKPFLPQQLRDALLELLA